MVLYNFGKDALLIGCAESRLYPDLSWTLNYVRGRANVWKRFVAKRRCPMQSDSSDVFQQNFQGGVTNNKIRKFCLICDNIWATEVFNLILSWIVLLKKSERWVVGRSVSYWWLGQLFLSQMDRKDFSFKNTSGKSRVRSRTYGLRPSCTLNYPKSF